MRALYTTAPGEYGLADRPVLAPAADEALVNVAAIGLCPNEVRIREGNFDVGYPALFPVISSPARWNRSGGTSSTLSQAIGLPSIRT